MTRGGAMTSDNVTVEYVRSSKGRVHKRYTAPSGARFTDERCNLDDARLTAVAEATGPKCRRCFRA
jgi:hypothetical protein